MKTYKTVENWLKELREPERTQAMQNLDIEDKDVEVGNLWFALGAAFDWHSSPQRWEYWNEICLKIIKGEYDKE